MLRQRLLRQCPTSRVDCRYRGARNVPNRSPRIGKLAAQAPAAAPAQTSSPFAAVQTEEQLLAVLKAGASSGQVPSRLMAAFDELYTNYKRAILSSGLPGADSNFVAKVMASVCERVMMQATQPYIFPSFHKRILEPYNYYNFGQRYIRGLVNFDTSFVGHVDRFKKIEMQLAAGENVVLLANHQTEADPAVFALLLEAECPGLATDVIYVAGDRVVTDPLCAPFSMGRNLFCVHSKKHLDDVPELKADKMATNRRTLKAMQVALNEGGQLLWIAPSGGRDRSIDGASGHTMPDAFDASAVELMRALSSKAKPAAHIYPFAMYSYQIMPPPREVQKSIGEKRVVFHQSVGISVCAELDVEKLVEGIEDKEARQAALADAAWKAVTEDYKALLAAIENNDAGDDFSRPWAKYPTPPLDQWLSP